MVSWDIRVVMGVGLGGVGRGMICWRARLAAWFKLVAVSCMLEALVCKVIKSWCSVSRTALAICLLSKSVRAGFGGEGTRFCLEM